MHGEIFRNRELFPRVERDAGKYAERVSRSRHHAVGFIVNFDTGTCSVKWRARVNSKQRRQFAPQNKRNMF